MGKTKEERYLIAAFEWVKAHGLQEEEFCDFEIDKVAVGKKAGLGDKGLLGTVHQLVRGNFLKKCGEDKVTLTPLSIHLIKELMGLNK